MQMVEILRIWDRIADLVIKSILSGIGDRIADLVIKSILSGIGDRIVDLVIKSILLGSVRMSGRVSVV